MHLASGGRTTGQSRGAGHNTRGLGSRLKKRRSAHASGLLVVALAAAATLGACGGGSSSASSHSKLDIADIAPFTGSQAILGTIGEGPCFGAVNVINAAGGVMGHKLVCYALNDLGDPADAVTNVTKALATNKSIVGAVGVTSNTAATEVPILNKAKIPMVSGNGLSLFSTTTDQYFYRMTPPDLLGGVGIGLAAVDNGYKKVAVLIQNDVGDTGNKPGIVSAFAKKGVSMTTDLTIPGDESTYDTTLSRVIKTHPDALIISADLETTLTLLSEYKSLNSGSVPPVIVPTDILGPGLYTGLKKSMGLSFIDHDFLLVGTYVDENGPLFKTYYNAVKGSPVGPKEALDIVATQAVATSYDGIILMALAMDTAKSTKTSVWNPYMVTDATKRPGAVEVNTYAQGVKELKAGHSIYYVGVTGPITFNKYHNSTGEFASFVLTGVGSTKAVRVFTPAEVAAVAPAA